jgi:uncharacterized protein (TIGR02996 family)
VRDDAAFLLHLSDHPEDLDTLLVYADWLDDHDDSARADFLRLQHIVVGLRHRQKGFSVHSKKLASLGHDLDPAWLAIVSRPRLAGTCWAGTDSRGSHYIWRYLPGGALNYTSDSGTYQNGTWRQIGNHVIMETNRRYADYLGFVGGDWIHGKAENVTDLKWTWKVKRTTDPEDCEYDEPDMTIYGGHKNDPVKRGRRRRRSSSGP